MDHLGHLERLIDRSNDRIAEALGGATPSSHASAREEYNRLAKMLRLPVNERAMERRAAEAAQKREQFDYMST